MHITHDSLAVADSLLDDVFYRAITVDFADDPPQRRLRLARYFAHSMEEGQVVGRVDTLGSDDALCGGAAVWTTSGNPARLEAARLVKMEALGETLGTVGLANYRAMVASMEQHLQGRLPADLWYLSILGVAPAQQGRGLGRQLLEPGLAAARSAGKGCYLETFTTRSVRFYERVGFTTSHTFVEPVTGQTYWVMVLRGGVRGRGSLEKSSPAPPE